MHCTTEAINKSNSPGFLDPSILHCFHGTLFLLASTLFDDLKGRPGLIFFVQSLSIIMRFHFPSSKCEVSRKAPKKSLKFWKDLFQANILSFFAWLHLKVLWSGRNLEHKSKLCHTAICHLTPYIFLKHQPGLINELQFQTDMITPVLLNYY